MQTHRTLSLALILGYCLLAQSEAQVSAQPSVSSDDISVADGLQLPTYGHVWALDTWKGIRELVRLRPPDTSADDSGFSLKLRRTIEFKGEAAPRVGCTMLRRSSSCAGFQAATMGAPTWSSCA